jgi:hypothetical protein
MTLIIDIETVPLAASLLAPYPEADRNPPANYKSDDAIAKWRASDRETWTKGWTKECSLNPRLGRVLCVGMPHGVVVAETEMREVDALREFWKAVWKSGGDVVTWNGGWDLRFLVIRSLARGIEPTVPSETIRSWFRKYATAPHFDCKAVLTNWEPFKAGEGLSEWGTFLCGGGKCEGMTGADVFPLYQLGHFQEIADYCAQDVAATLAIYNKIAPMFAHTSELAEAIQ